MQLAVEVAVELAPRAVEPPRQLEHARAHPRRELVEERVLVEVRQPEADDPAVGRGHVAGADRRVEARVGDLGEALCGGALGELVQSALGGSIEPAGEDPAQLGGFDRIHRWTSSRSIVRRSCWSPSATRRRAAASLHVERRRDLAVGEVGGEAQRDRLAAGVAERRDPGPDVTVEIAEPSPARLGDRLGQIAAGLGPAHPGPVVVDRFAAGDRHNPGARVGAVHAVVAAQRGDHRLLKAVLGVVFADHRPQEGEHRARVRVDEALKRGPRGGR